MTFFAAGRRSTPGPRTPPMPVDHPRASGPRLPPRHAAGRPQFLAHHLRLSRRHRAPMFFAQGRTAMCRRWFLACVPNFDATAPDLLITPSPPAPRPRPRRHQRLLPGPFHPRRTKTKRGAAPPSPVSNESAAAYWDALRRPARQPLRGHQLARISRTAAGTPKTLPIPPAATTCHRFPESDFGDKVALALRHGRSRHRSCPRVRARARVRRRPRTNSPACSPSTSKTAARSPSSKPWTPWYAT